MEISKFSKTQSLCPLKNSMYRYVKYSARRQVRPSTCTTRVVHISVYQIEESSEVVCQVLSSLNQWLYGNTFHCTHRHRSAANTTTKHSHIPNSSHVTAINGTEPSWELEILLQTKPVGKCYNTASIIHSHRHKNRGRFRFCKETNICVLFWLSSLTISIANNNTKIIKL